MSWTSIISYISYARIAEILEINTDTEYVAKGELTEDGINYVFDYISEYCREFKKQHGVEPAEEIQLKEENNIIQKLVDQYIDPVTLIKRIDWTQKFQFINDYAAKGSQLDFVRDSERGLALIWFEVEGGFSLTIFPSIMTVITDISYLIDSLLPEYNYEDVNAEDVIETLINADVLKLCSLELDDLYLEKI